MNEYLKDLVVIVFLAIMAGALIPVLKKAYSLIDTFQKAKIKSDALNEAIDIIQAAVLKVAQTYVTSIKNTPEWNDDAQKKAFELAKTEAITLIPAASKEIIAEVHNDFDSYVNIQIEKAVKAIK